MPITRLDRKYGGSDLLEQLCLKWAGPLLLLLLLCFPTTKAGICMPLTGKVEVWKEEKKNRHGP